MMNKIQLNWLIIMMLLLVLFGCGESYVPKREDIQKYPFLNIFTPELDKFQGKLCDLDVGILSFHFTTSFKGTYKEYFNFIEKNAISDGWELLKKNEAEIVFKKNMNQENDNVITLNYFFSEGRFYLTWKVTPIFPKKI